MKFKEIGECTCGFDGKVHDPGCLALETNEERTDRVGQALEAEDV